MNAILEAARRHRVRPFRAGEVLLEEGPSSGRLLVLLRGEVEVLRHAVRIARTAEPGAVFGEMSALLGGPHTASVRAVSEGELAVIEDPVAFLAQSADASLEIARMLARRLDTLSRYLVDVKRQYEGHDHLQMVDEVLDTLMHRPTRSSRP